MIIIVATTSEEIKEAFAWLTENTDADSIVKTNEIQKQKKSDYDKKRYQEKKNFTMEKVKNGREKREEERESFSPSSPSSLSSSPLIPPNNNPITPIIPSSQEKEGERKESGADIEKASRTASRRGELKAFGAHVKLSEKEFLSLQEKFGYEKALEKIEWMNNYIGEDPKRERVYQSRNHYLTILNWDRMDQERKQKPQAAEQPKEETWMEVAERIQRERDAKKEVIDL